MKAVIFALVAGICWGVGEFFTKQVLHSGKIGPITAITVRTTVALPVLWAVYFFTVHVKQMEPQTWLSAPPRVLWMLVLGSGLVTGAIGMLFFYGALHLGPISKIKPIAFTIAPLVAVILGWTVLGEGMTVRKALAIMLIVGGVVLLTGER